jgi:hypothetical protein
MPVLLLILLLPLVVNAQISFDPVRLDDSTALSYSVPGIAVDSGDLRCNWAAVYDTSISACVRRASASGEPLSGMLFYESEERSGQTCPPELHVVHTLSGGEARLVYHSCDAEINVRFLSSEGEVVDSLHRGRVVNPAISRTDQGLLLVYTDFILNQALILRLDDDGTIRREDTVNVSNVEFALAEGSQAVLIAFSINMQAMTETFCAYRYNAFGVLDGSDTLMVDTLQSGDLDAGHVYACQDSQITVAAPVVQQFATPLAYRMRLMRYRYSEAMVFTPWNIAAIPEGSHIQSWSLAEGPNGSGVIGYYVRDDVGENELRFEAFDGAGQASEVHHTISIPFAPTDVNVSGLSLSILDESVYALFTLSAVDSGVRGGVSLAAFPLSELLSAGERPRIIPRRFNLTAYPNPFNSAVRLDYELPHAGEVRLRIFDISGRLVGERDALSGTSGQGTILWSMDGYPSGVYFARLSSGKLQTGTQLHLIR